MTTKQVNFKSLEGFETAELRELAALPGIGRAISVRAAKAHLSALLELVTGGQQVTLTSDGAPKARLVSAVAPMSRKTLQDLGEYLETMPMQSEVPLADELVRTGGDGRG